MCGIYSDHFLRTDSKCLFVPAAHLRQCLKAPYLYNLDFRLVLILMVYSRAKRRFLSNIVCRREEVLATKVVLLFLVVVVVTAVAEIALFDVLPVFLDHFVM